MRAYPVSGEESLESGHVKLEAMPEARTLLTIRVGVFGDKNKSVVLFDQIVQNLAQREDTFTKYHRLDRDP